MDIMSWDAYDKVASMAYIVVFVIRSFDIL